MAHQEQIYDLNFGHNICVLPKNHVEALTSNVDAPQVGHLG